MKTTLLRISALIILLVCGATSFPVYSMDAHGDNTRPTGVPSSSSEKRTFSQQGYENDRDEENATPPTKKQKPEEDTCEIFPVPTPPTDLTPLISIQIQSRTQKAKQGNTGALNDILKRVMWGVMRWPFTFKEILAFPDIQTKVMTDERYVHLVLDTIGEFKDLTVFPNLTDRITQKADAGSAVYQYFAGIILSTYKKIDIGAPPILPPEKWVTLSDKEIGCLEYNLAVAVFADHEDFNLESFVDQVMWGNFRLSANNSRLLKGMLKKFPSIKEKIIGTGRDDRYVNLVLKLATNMGDLADFQGLESEIQQQADQGSMIDQHFIKEINAIRKNEQSQEDSNNYMIRSANQNYAPALYNLVEKEFKTFSCSSTSETLHARLKTSADLGYAPALNELSKSYLFNSAHFKTAVDLLHKAAKLGYSLAQMQLGTFCKGTILNPDTSEEVKINPIAGSSWTLMSVDLDSKPNQLYLEELRYLEHTILDWNEYDSSKSTWSLLKWEENAKECLDQLDRIIPIKDRTNQSSGGFQENQTASTLLGIHYGVINSCLQEGRKMVGAVCNHIKPGFMISSYKLKPTIDIVTPYEYQPPFLLIKAVTFSEMNFEGISTGFMNVIITKLFEEFMHTHLPAAKNAHKDSISFIDQAIKNEEASSVKAKEEIRVLQEALKKEGLNKQELEDRLENAQLSLCLANKAVEGMNSQYQEALKEQDALNRLNTLFKEYITQGAHERNLNFAQAFPSLHRHVRSDGSQQRVQQ